MITLFYIWGVLSAFCLIWQIVILSSCIWSIGPIEESGDDLKRGWVKHHYYSNNNEYRLLQKEAALYTLGVPFHVALAPLYFLALIFYGIYKLIKLASWRLPKDQHFSTPPVEEGPYK